MAILLDNVEIALLCRMILAHVLTDFALQPGSFVAQRLDKKWSSWWLYVHGVLAGVMVYLFAWQWNALWLFLAVALSHIVIDGLKSMSSRTLGAFVWDQAAHLAVLVVCWSILIDLNADGVLESMRSIAGSPNVWIIMLSYAVAIWPGGVVVGHVAGVWAQDMAGGENGGLKNAGLLIGRLERVLILTFVFYQQYEAIGLLVAAKSIFRFGGGDSSLARKQTEYFVIGTLLSFVIAIVIGAFARMLLATIR